jgi:hypothetical protein
MQDFGPCRCPHRDPASPHRRGRRVLLRRSAEEGNRAQDLLQQAEQAQADLDSATFEASIGFQIGGSRSI